ncbi:MAG TPA: hypothetical protein VE462_11350 [Propionibacteriaceae bacterium]|nr:hypothetical protein [Propionibacteriaceae bacterium]
MSSMPALRLRGRGDRVRLRKIGRWDRDPLVEVKVACRTSVAVEKMLAESLRGARDAGCSWSSIASALGVAPTLSSWDQIAAALAFNRRVVWNRVVGER